jgi:hypothetical protein
VIVALDTGNFPTGGGDSDGHERSLLREDG